MRMTTIKPNESGFGIIEIVLVLCLLAAVGFAGWYVVSSQKESLETNIAEESKDNNGSMTQMLPSFALPEGWSMISCDSVDTKGHLLSPDSDAATDCDDRENTVLITTISGESAACFSDVEIEQIKKSKPISGYSCEPIDVNGTSVIKAVGDYGGGPTMSYSFKSKAPLSINYYSNKDGSFPDAVAVGQLVDSITIDR